MSFGRKIANRIVLAYLVPVTFMLALGILIIHLQGDQIRLRDYVLGMALVLIPTLIIGRLLTYSITAHLEQLRRSAEQIEHGEYKARVVPGSEDEFADLARAFNHMADVLAQRESALREQNQTLAALNHRFEAVLNAANDGIAMLDRDGCFVLVNRRFGELVGLRAPALLHHTLEEVRPLLIDRLSHRLAALAPSETRAVAEEIIALEEPDRRFLQFYTAPVAGEDGHETIGRIIALRDITRERELDKMKTDFISVVSHELRTPLTSIKGYTDLLLSGATGELAELQSEFLGIIQLSTTRLSNLINDILDISRIESGTLEIKHEPIDYRKIVADTLRLMKAAADAKQVSMDAALPETIPPVRGDTDKVTQVLTNLVSNAIKYTPEGGWVKVSLEVSGEASVTTCVADSGIGIMPDDQKKLFQKFFRADNSSTREAGGTGLGLVIAKTLIELLGGAIWLESEPGRGSRFYFTLPLFLETSGAAAPSAVELPERGIGLVLIVDDDAYVRSLIRHALHRRGYGTLEASDCAEAQQKARLHKPDAVTLDMMMPEMDGLRTLRALKSDRATAPIPIVVVSVLGDPARGDLTLGAFSFLQKPLQSDLSVSVATAVGGKSEEKRALLVCGSDTPVCRDFEAAASGLLADYGIALTTIESPSDAVAYVITETPGLILLDTAMPDAELFDLLTALKAEEEAARIPIVLLTEDINPDSLHFHAGADMEGNGALLDHLCELLSRSIPTWEMPVK
ncbi:MAG: ATP-binding protein [Janthinobacterium lividum]